MKDMLPFVDILINHAKARLGADLELVLHYGSRTKDYAAPKSDFDMFYVPTRGKNIWHNWTYLVGGVNVDLFPQQWENLESKANFEHDHTPVLIEAKILYCKSDEVRMRYEALRNRVLELQQPNHAKDMLQKAIDRFQKAAYHLVILEHVCSKDDLRSWRKESLEIADGIVHCLTVLNQTYFPKWWVRCIDRVRDLPKRPDGIDQMLYTLAVNQSYETVCSAAVSLVCKTREVLVREQQVHTEKRDRSHQWLFYPEYHDMYEKTIRACADNLAEVNASAMHYTAETALARAKYVEGVAYSSFNIPAEYATAYDTEHFPNIVSCKSREELPKYQEILGRHDAMLKELLQSEGHDLYCVETEEELKASLSSRP